MPVTNLNAASSLLYISSAHSGSNVTFNTTNFIPGNVTTVTAPTPAQAQVAQIRIDNVRAQVATITPVPTKPVALQAISFCMPSNPVGNMYLMHAEVNLYKIRNCMNIAGIERVLDPFAAPTDTTSGLPYIGVGGNLVLPQDANFVPSQYRFDFLIERAKQLVNLAQQMEAAMLSAREKYDAEQYAQLQAKQQLKLSREGIKLNNLQVKRAEGEVDLAQLQLEKAEFQEDHYDALLAEGLIGWEHWAMDTLIGAAAFQTTAATLYSISAVSKASSGIFAAAAISDTGFAMQSIANALSSNSQLFSMIAGFKRREQEWSFAKGIASKDIGISKQQVKLAQTGVQIAGQELRIAELQEQNAQDTLAFLQDKFTNAELYNWMSGILENVYSKFLSQATSIALLAQNQLAFERQEVPPQYIKTDYWESPVNPGDQKAPDRKGLTGSARLTQDLYSLEQYALDTNVRRLQMSKTISLALHDPSAFQRFKETGVLKFETPMEMFDRDFPGHYVRLIKQVKTSVIGLIPPNDGIKATLSAAGTSRVITKNGFAFEQAAVKSRVSDSVALTSPINATGMFEMQPVSNMLNPFEGLGVETQWVFEMYKAANMFDYNTIADVLITIEYTALNSFEYKTIVLKDLDNLVDANLSFSLKNNFPDQWYDLNNQNYTDTNCTISLDIARADYPYGLIEDPTIKRLVLYFAKSEGNEAEQVSISSYKFTVPAPDQKTIPASSVVQSMVSTNADGVISTDSGSSWPSLVGQKGFGKLELTFPQTGWFKDGTVTDVILMINYQSERPAFPLT